MRPVALWLHSLAAIASLIALLNIGSLFGDLGLFLIVAPGSAGAVNARRRGGRSLGASSGLAGTW